MSETILHMQSITKKFESVTALSEVDFSLRQASVHALMGENGAGKSTLMKVLTGTYSDYEGTISLYGKNVRFHNESDALAAGISIVPQELNPIPNMTIAENIFLGRFPETKVKGFVNRGEMFKAADALIEGIGLNCKSNVKMRDLSVAQQQLVEIIKAISRDSKIIVMDEPTSALTDVETQFLFERIRRLKDEGITIVFITHKIDEAMLVCDTLTVLRDGRHIGTKPVSELDMQAVINMMVGREIADIYPPIFDKTDEVLFETKGLTSHSVFHDVSFNVKRGEILGIAGIMGAGRSEIMRAIFGLDTLESGEVLMEGRPLRLKSCRDAIKEGIVMVTEDRKQYGFVSVRSICDNVMLPNSDIYAPKFTIKRNAIQKDCEDICGKIAVKAPAIHTRVSTLSGGNQQKVVLSKWLIRNLNTNRIKLMILDEPTRGIDVGAKFEIYKIMADLANQGMSIIMISSELPEVLGMSHRVLVVAEGEIRGELDRSEFSQKRIMEMIIGEDE